MLCSSYPVWLRLVAVVKYAVQANEQNITSQASLEPRLSQLLCEYWRNQCSRFATEKPYVLDTHLYTLATDKKHP